MKHRELARSDNISMGIEDTRNYYVARITVVEKGKRIGEEDENKTFHSNLASAISEYATQIARKDAKTIQELLETHKRVVRELQDACEGV